MTDTWTISEQNDLTNILSDKYNTDTFYWW